jgi:hypothetical protein
MVTGLWTRSWSSFEEAGLMEKKTKEAEEAQFEFNMLGKSGEGEISRGGGFSFFSAV